MAGVPVYLFWTIGGALFAYSLALLSMGEGLTALTPVTERPLSLFAWASIAAGLVFLGLVAVAPRLSLSRTGVWMMIALGLVMRVVLIPAEPIREDDHYRYMLDGAVLAQGLSPYTFSPAEITSDPELKARLTGQAGSEAFARINHPELKTIYPPAAQGTFLLAHLIAPWRAEGLRLVFLAADLAGLCLLLRLLSIEGKGAALAAIYWWNPLTLAQVYGHAHMEGLLFAPILLALLAAAQARAGLGGVALGIGAAIKVWPVLLAPPLLGFYRRVPASALKATFACAAVAGLALWPLVLASIEPQSGVAAYATRWLFNDPFLALSFGGTMWTGVSAGLSPEAVQAGFRVALAGLAIGGALYTAWRAAAAQWDLPYAFLVATLILFLLSPAKFPWYALWFAPLIALRPSLAAASYMATMPVFYLRPGFEAAGTPETYDWAIAWIPVLAFSVILTVRGLRDVR